MTPLLNRQIVLASRPSGMPTDTNFRIVKAELPRDPGSGVVLRTLWLSLDPYMRGKMNEGKSYTQPVQIGEVMDGGTVSQVISSRVDGLEPGDFVVGYTGWQEYAHVDGKSHRKLDPGTAPLSTALGILGMPGMTAYTGLLNIGRPKSGKTLVVAAASGAVGSVVGQIGKIKGCRVVGIAGGSAKVAYVKDELGFDDAIDHHAPDFADRLSRACPKGIDIYFENVGGRVWEGVFPLLNNFARIPVCGLIANYNMTELPVGRDHVPELMRAVLSKRLAIQGFIVGDFASQAADFQRDVGGWFREGRLKYREHIIDGLENAPAALIGMLKGENFGKLLIKVADPQ